MGNVEGSASGYLTIHWRLNTVLVNTSHLQELCSLFPQSGAWARLSWPAAQRGGSCEEDLVAGQCRGNIQTIISRLLIA